ncbi:MAG: hypothetical protein IT437_10820 [Phycisphaerales bacterium]|nr:hypothetical protein [Phycisphaerales bacterium]
MNGPAARRAAFWVYVPILFTATHWPRLVIPAEGRPDLWIHVGVLGLWTALLIGCGFFGRPLSARNIITSAVIGVLYAGLDEGLQAIPWVHRTAAWDDFAADSLGVVLAAAVALVIGCIRGPGES